MGFCAEDVPKPPVIDESGAVSEPSTRGELPQDALPIMFKLLYRSESRYTNREALKDMLASFKVGG
jgi:hypothetical protein